ncbi:hypothetical protein HELRODRAFT_88258 [Helobdella robusta]|uniref:vitamin-K-epoxide reductase (warfarin-sensitive) n=1 Tax=Helobdella robusta TaxID=6412 RepID=T1G708_HELRO|nr:hypothetical protein HELRODRAFT_88258 [Helobdella robusta]ESN93796.1 hypothetical protein HELRODRAFT_88258 [Helobdella robusta]
MEYLFDIYTIVCLVGIALSVYAWHVERNKKCDKDYIAFCDLGANMQCSRVLTSEYSVGFGIFGTYLGCDSILNRPNCELGMIFYAAQIVVLTLLGPFASVFLFLCSFASCIMSVYLAYLLAFKLKDICVVCISTYIVNFILLYISFNRL